tara:strand:- start:30 stop:788 length:759 start_codon:yes stop_codon:yes gene_type:complete
MLSAIYILLDIPLHVQEEAVLHADFTKLLDMDNLDIQNLLSDNGLFQNDKVAGLVKGVLQHKYNRDDLTLKELYDIKPILLTVKCVNVTKGCNEYINKNTNPDLSILTLLLMTTAIPIFFQPVKYNDCFYVDGGLTGGYPIEIVKDNYLGFLMNVDDEKKDINTGISFLDYIINLTKVKVINYDNYPDKYNIRYSCNLHFSEFNVPINKKKELIQLGYDITIQHLEKYNITNDLFRLQSKEHLEDSDPIETA